MMEASLENVGTVARYGELCGVSAPRRDRWRTEALANLRPCLNELGFKGPEIADALQSGAAVGNSYYERVGSKELFCKKVREDFGQ